MTKTRLLLLGGVCAMVVTLTGCDNNAFMSPLSAKRDGDALLVAMCGAPVDIERIYAEAQNRDEGVQWFRFWDAKGRASFETGEVVSFENGVEGLEITVNETALLSEGTDLAITMVSVIPGKSLSTDLHIRGGQLSEETWLHPDGSTSDTPCGDDGT